MGNNDDIKARLRQVLEVKKSNVSKITEGEDVKRSTLSAQINGNSSVSYDTIKLFLRKFTDLSADWLINGIGTMLNNCGCSSADDESIYHPSSDGCELLSREEEGRKSESEQARFYKEQAEFYKEQAEFYKQQLDSLKGRQ